MSIEITAANSVEADALSEVLVASITELCANEHENDPELLAGWLSNKTPDHVRRWIETGCSHVLTARHSGVVAGIGGTHPTGEILLNYVAPGHRGVGVSTALLAAMEQDLAAAGHGVIRLTSTLTAHDFYLKRGWQNDGPAIMARGIRGWPMVKHVGAG